MDSVELTLTHPAAGGGFVGRDEGGRVVFVRHGLPGERVRAEITEDHARWARADAIEILEPSPDRVTPRCSLAGPGRCGGCDYQHASLDAQRRFKTQLLSEQLRRVAKLDLVVAVEVVDPGDGLHNRTRVRFGTDAEGRLGMRRHHSHDLMLTSECPLATEEIAALALGEEEWPAGADVEACVLNESTTPTVLVTEESDELESDGPYDDDEEFDGGAVDVDSAAPQHTVVGERTYLVSPGVFWQVHRLAPSILVEAVLDGLDLAGGESVLDLYCGAGLFTKAIAEIVGPDGLVVGVEGSPHAAADARRNTATMSWVDVMCGSVEPEVLAEAALGATHVVIDPPRRGMTTQALDALIGVETITRVVSVSCNAATFARDLKRFLDAGFVLDSIRAFDLFEMTEHLEIVAVLTRDRSDAAAVISA